MFPKAAVLEPQSPSRRPPQPWPPCPGGMGTGHHFVLEQVCPWASPGQRLPITLNMPSSVRLGSCQGKHCAGGPSSPLFLFAVAFFLMFLMILQRSPNDEDEGTARGSPRAALAPGDTAAPRDRHPLSAGHPPGQAMGMGTGTALQSRGCTTEDRAATGRLPASRDVLSAQPGVSKSARINE